jgi:hypothetical protein
MPRFGNTVDDVLVNMRVLRQYLATTAATTPAEVFNDAFVGEEPAVLDVIVQLLQLRGNRRTRRTLRDVRQEWRRVTSAGFSGEQARWYVQLERLTFATVQQWRAYAFPVRQQHHHQDTLTHGLSRAQRRMLGFTGAVRVELPTLLSRARDAAAAVWNGLAQEDAIVWVDNWYVERYAPDPMQPCRSLNATAIGVLFLHTTNDQPAARTRSLTLSQFPGHPTVHQLAVAIPFVTDLISDAFVRLCRRAVDVAQVQLLGSMIRVPLDVVRPARSRRQWRGVGLSNQRVGSSLELLGILQDVTELQQQAGRTLPLLVDEKVHYSICRLLYSGAFSGLAGREYLHRIPLLYGVWHPYKHCLTVLYRKFMPVLALLECTGVPAVGSSLRTNRKVVFMEKMAAALLLIPASQRQQVVVAAQRATDPHTLVHASMVKHCCLFHYTGFSKSTEHADGVRDVTGMWVVIIH